jgi:hypothetical protein
MKRPSRLLRLYPSRWRARYEDEFLALLEDLGPSRGLVLDVAIAAVRARLEEFSAGRRPRVASGLTSGGELMVVLSRQSQLLFAIAAVLALLGVAGFFLHSFAYVLALGLAAVFGVAGAASVSTRLKSRRMRGLLFGFVITLAFVATYLFLVSGGGGPPAPSPSR